MKTSELTDRALDAAVEEVLAARNANTRAVKAAMTTLGNGWCSKARGVLAELRSPT